MFKPVEAKPDFPKMEKKILKSWYESGLVEKCLHKNDSSKKKFSFLDGPITANNPMGVHHAWGRTYKDLWQRYYNMRGFRERFQNGFDCQGLWVEVEVEKELGFKNKKDIEKYGIARFVNKCKKRVLKFAKIQTEQSKRLGYFMDWGNSYYTMSEENNYAIWNFLKVCQQNGWLYKGEDSVPWCPRCGTAISQHEILTEDYKEITHQTVFFRLPVLNKDFSLLLWTTTPWTVPANVAVAVNPEFSYRIWREEKSGEKMIFIREDSLPKRERYEDYIEDKKFLDSILQGKNWQGVTDLKGSELIGFHYLGPFDHLERVKKAREENFKTFHTIVAAKDLVVATKGTGILHVAPGAGEEDYKLSKEENLPVIEVIDEEANYYDGLGEFGGKNAKLHPEIIINYLKQKDNGKFFYEAKEMTHRYPVCWRCKTELVWRVVDEWYISMDSPSKSKVKSQKSKVRNKTLRQRMIEVAKKIRWIPGFGLKRELDWLKNMKDWLISKKRYWGLALPIWECEECGRFEVIGGREELKRKAVRGWKKFTGQTPHRPWIDEIKIKCSNCGSLMSRIADVGNPWLDAGIVSISTIPTGWFPADFITESFPGQFKNWFYSLIAMATVLTGKPPFKTVLGFATLLAEDGQPMHKSLGNMIEFNEGADKIGVDVMRWMYVRQNSENNLLFGYKKADETRRKFQLLLWNVYKFFVTYANLEDYDITILRYYDIVSNNILDEWIISRLQRVIKVVTERLDDYDAYWASEAIEDFVSDLSTWYVRRSREREDKNNLFTILNYVLVTLSKLLAPFTPFIAEEIYKNITEKESVHLADWPEVKPKDSKTQRLKEIIKGMKLVRKICELGHAERKKAGIKVRQPLKKLRITDYGLRITKEYENLIKDELNVKQIEWIAGKGELQVKLDIKITPELREEGKARELVRKIQLLRKKKGCQLDEWIRVEASSWPKKFADYIKKKTLTKQLKQGKELKILLS